MNKSKKTPYYNNCDHSVRPGKFLIRVLYFLLFTGIWTIFGCSTTKTLNDNEYLYKGHEINITDKTLFDKWKIKSGIKKQIKPEPNKEILGIAPFQLWVYNFIGDSIPEKGVRNWIRRKAGEEPVLYNNEHVRRSENQIREFLYHKGYFDNQTTSDIHLNNKKAEVTYEVETNTRYKYDSIAFPEITDTLTKHIVQSQTTTLLEKGKGYDLEQLEKERERISRYLNNHGYYYIIPDHFIFELDSNKQKHSLDIFLRIKEGIPKRLKLPYTIDEIFIDSDHSLGSSEKNKDTIDFQNTKYIYHTKEVNPALITNSLMFEKGDLYSRQAYEISLNKLSGTGIYKFTNIQFEPEKTDSLSLNSYVNLTPRVPGSLKLEVQAVTKSNDYTGPVLDLSYTNINAFKGAETFSLKLNSSFETQFSKQHQGGNSFEAGFDTELSIPRFIFPFIDLNKYLSKKYTPETSIRGGYSFHHRTRYFKMNSFHMLYSYAWRETSTNTHDLNLLNITYSRITKKTSRFEEILENNQFIRQSFNEELIFGLKYNFTYNNQLQEDKNINTYFSINNELAGNILSLYNYLATGEKPDHENPATILGIKYAQYAKVQADYRFYLNTGQRSRLAGRLLAGIGMGYGNSQSLPYVKQFYIGGASDIRAFRSHTVGPGSYRPPDSIQNTYFEQTGDLKLEANLEYRFRINKLLNGALFMDAGNIWLLSNSNNRSDGKFNPEEFMKEWAVGSGIGLRLDVSLLVLRMDLGIPLRKPWLSENERWVLKDFDLADPEWRSKNLVLNIAIGYPF